mmetsp:Transcript_10904/g.34743  ORF Transcript_10904/g.34743 Transcript_10904/m.34743 type:complete len:206 (-) Transcript_10904:176-793(-)
MRSICLVLFAIGAAQAVSTNLRSTANSDGLRAVVNLYHAAQAGQGPLIGEATLQDSSQGLMIRASIYHLPPGKYGFFVHENGDCGAEDTGRAMVPAGKSGRVLSERIESNGIHPHSTHEHRGHLAGGYLGDLPPIEIDSSLMFEKPLFAPRLRLADVLGRSLVIGTARFPDKPPKGVHPMNIACGIVPVSSVSGDSTLALGLTNA